MSPFLFLFRTIRSIRAIRIIYLNLFSLVLLFVVLSPAHAATCNTTVQANQSIQVKVDQATPGDTICLATGTYQQIVNLNKAGLTFTAAPGANPVIDGKYQIPTSHAGQDPRWNSAPLITIAADNITISNITIQNSLGRGINVGDNSTPTIHNAKILNNEIYGSRTQAITVNPSENTLIQDNLLEYNATKNFTPINHQGGAQLNVQDANGTIITRNIIRYGGHEGIIIDANRGGSTNSQVTYNIVHDNKAANLYSHGTDKALWEGNLEFISLINPYFTDDRPSCMSNRVIEKDDAELTTKRVFGDITVRNNIFWGCPDINITNSVDTVSNVVYKNVLFTHNTMVLVDNQRDTNYVGFQINNVDKTGSRFENVQITNNLISVNDNINFTPIATAGNLTGVSFNSNIWNVSIDGFDQLNNDATVANTRLVGQDGNGRFTILTRMPPGGYEEIRSWFKLKSNSPAIDAAQNSTATLDHWQSTRDNKPDVGAHEFGSTPVTINPSPTSGSTTWDLNHDNRVNILDFTHLLLRFPSNFSFPNLAEFVTTL